MPKGTGAGAGAGAEVIAVCIDTETVEGVRGMGIGIAFGVLFSSHIINVVVFKGVVNDRSLVGIVFCTAVSPCVLKSSNKLFILDFDNVVQEIGENGFRIIGDRGSQALTAAKECFLIGTTAMSKPLLPVKR